MHLKSLEIQGFKSFTERTLILFHQGVTAIVGPNGSGKSNVTDAIRWVLGEQSARALRGGKMEDVIFAGTNTRRPLGFAEVTMLIDNTDAQLPIEYSEVAITRRLFRSGESNYLINQTPCRLKDVHSLFMDTGLGRDGYSIIGQGRVDEILSTKSEDRRRVFEEASGIQKFKTRRDEALRKLEQTESNLTRVNDILTELSGQLGPMKKQAEQAQQYLQWYEELKQVEVALTLHSIDSKSALFKEQRLHLEVISTQSEAAIEASLALEEKHRRMRTRLGELTLLLQEGRRNKDLRNLEREAALTNVAHLKSQKEQNKLEQNSHQSAVAQLGKQKADLHDELAARQIQAEEDEKQLDSVKRRVQELQESAQKLNGEISGKVAAQNRIRENLSRAQSVLLDIRGQKSQQAVTREQLALVQIDLKGQLENAAAEREQLTAELIKLNDEHALAAQADQQAQTMLLSQEAGLNQAKKELSSLQGRYNQEVQQLDQLGFKLDTLREMQQNMEGYNEAVKFVLDYAKRETRFKQAIKGSVGSLVSVPGDYERALEVALGAGIQNVVVQDEKTAAELINVLKVERKGRVTFLPLYSVKPHFLNNEVLRKIETQRGGDFLGLAHELINYPPEIAAAIELLLARTVISPDLAAATRLARQFGQSLKIVTLDGEVINPGGAMTGGQYKNQSSLLSRKRLLSEALESYKSYEKLLPQSEKKIAQSSQALKTRGQELEATAQSALLLRQKLAFHEAQIEQMQARIGRIESLHAQLRERLSKLEAQERGSGSDLDKLAEQESAALAGLTELEAQIKAHDEMNSAHASEREAMRDTLARAETDYQLHFQKYQAERSIDARIHTEIARLETQMAEHTAAIAALNDNSIINESAILAAEKTLQTLSNSSGAEEQALIKLEEEQSKLDTEAAQLFDTLREHNARLNAVEAEKNRLENRTEQLSMQLDELRNKLWENYNLTYDNAAKYRVENLQSGLAGPRVQSLKQAIRALGAVNVNAVEDYQSLSQRHDFLKKQEDDILQAKAQLDQLINEMTLVMRQQFNENFTKINENFQVVFRELFGGGKAEISLEANKDILEGDIEIKASPPGKKLQNMLLLSGGERSLAAIALLFAILKLRPTPFCVLDEIEAALDDSNVFRFTDYIKNYADNTQFILVTHRKGTMEAADSIYGVTMQELGVSRILSLELGD